EESACGALLTGGLTGGEVQRPAAEILVEPLQGLDHSLRGRALRDRAAPELSLIWLKRFHVGTAANVVPDQDRGAAEDAVAGQRLRAKLIGLHIRLALEYHQADDDHG